ncbi:TonB system transport protein ExbD [Campylobacter blaseri]|uniref:Biopolymer transport protein ExbD n=1 Tax=Campylobacter blaseri TaxID=2042961 RepID=A0A2P8QZU1_9BACT|nr:biopolymer transporter ExbD [Campylobacter blaseri]PSM51764.1 hypothetical protein CQ405_06445 [Campylobacter blaseri]PSM53555.1 hypothetical protein CRN67_06450 [Campylobacter blaseri]QKF86363.1 TonB system transport protein ExbD [Campylobacter blaseri]
MEIKNNFKLNVIPLIDVMLVLLAIVLTAASFIEYGKIDVKLPKQNTSLKKEDIPKERVEIILSSDSQIRLNNQNLDLDSLKIELSKLKKDDFILFKGDQKAEFGKFVDILQILKYLDLQNFLIMTQVEQ